MSKPKLKSYSLQQASVERMPRHGATFSVFVPGVDAHTSVRAGSIIAVTDKDGGSRVDLVVDAKHYGPLAQLISAYGPSHYATHGQPYSFEAVAEDLEANYEPDGDNLSPTDVRRMYTVFQVVAPMDVPAAV